MHHADDTGDNFAVPPHQHINGIGMTIIRTVVRVLSPPPRAHPCACIWLAIYRWFPSHTCGNIALSIICYSIISLLIVYDDFLHFLPTGIHVLMPHIAYNTMFSWSAASLIRQYRQWKRINKAASLSGRRMVMIYCSVAANFTTYKLEYYLPRRSDIVSYQPLTQNACWSTS